MSIGVSFTSSHPSLVMPSSFAGESRLSQLLSTIGQKRSADEIEAQSAIVKRRKQDKLDCRRKIEIARNQSTYSDAIIKPILEKERVTTTEDLEIVEADKDPEDIDVLYESRAYDGRLSPYTKLI